MVELKIEGSIGYIEFSHPKANALDKKNLEELYKGFDQLNKNNQVHIIVLSSKKEEKKNVFSSGAFLDELKQAKDQEELSELFFNFARLMLEMIRSTKLIIGIVIGKAIGGALGLIASCDYVFSHRKTRFKLSELSFGIGPLVIEPVLSYKIGRSNFMKIALHPKKEYKTSWAYQIGLIHKIAKRKNIQQEAITFAKELCGYSSRACSEIKKANWSHIDPLLEDLLQKRSFINAHLWAYKNLN